MSISGIACLGEDKHDRDSGKRCLPVGIIKADVDNFGIISSAGLAPMTISKHLAISFFTSFFFSTFLNALARKYGIYTIYLGGDDVTALGDMISVTEFSRELNEVLALWSSGRLKISAGISDFSMNFPLRRGVELAEDYLEMSKEEKNRITLFSRTTSWKALYQDLSLAGRISGSVRDGKIGSYFPYLLIKLDGDNPYNRQISGGTVLQLPDPIISYYLSRNWTDRSDSGKMERDALLSEIIKSEVFRDIGIVANMSVLRTRLAELKEDG